MVTHFLFMDENYAEPGARPQSTSVSLTGLLVPTAKNREFRSGYYTLVHQALQDPAGTVSPMPTIHAMELFPDKDDATKLRFLEGIVELAVDVWFRVYRIGYHPTPELTRLTGMTKQGIVGLCFASMLFCLKDALTSAVIWPVMEIDQTPDQDRSFAGSMQFTDFMNSRFGGDGLSIDYENLGEVVYSTKRSAYGSAVDCVAYLLHAKFLREIG